ncbi:hypothetical protein BRADO3852 [Bradyrhizobium sp. ORS 278]|uniref:D-Ala-D-Ala carboxypeptidase family metallohydrolase n=1 Tax=Bradyrhizobium sp. (strain ORS 278) TaxID=114615 RepID=UPI0001508882|nr:D-Ala-D-Ala carboxypeptidase family metallohydrolase [Bradyrhizobium sp. ORS 278]CAL77616.1 hypothetical protein BRADO3852 [Bradyrhizobium sp. ORS 278]
MLDKLREELGVPIRILSVYRSPLYNRCIDGSAVNSFHMQFMAIDFSCDSGSPASWRPSSRSTGRAGVAAGIGGYSSFAHVDTRGDNINWTGPCPAVALGCRTGAFARHAPRRLALGRRVEAP